MKVHVSTYGCSASQASAEIMKAAIRDRGHSIVPEKDADVLVINTCTVKYTTEQKILHKIRKAGELGKEVVVSGCMPEVQLDEILAQNPDAHILGVNSISRIGMLLDSLYSGQKNAQFFQKEPEGFQDVPRMRFNPNIHICQLSQGCNYSCAYCIVSIARGRLRSFEPREIVADIRSAVFEGCREIWLTSQDNGQYGTDGDVLLPELLDMICSIPGDFKVRVGMMNPFSVLPVLDDLLDAFENEKVYKLLHLPVQSASDSVLERMNRYHSIEEANNVIRRFRERFDDLTLFTDIIVGYPGEEEEDFKRTLRWVKEFRPDKVNISRYTPRPLTKALEYRQIDSRITVKRSNVLHDVCEKMKLDSKNALIGREFTVFISKEAKLRGMMARTDSYLPVVIPECDQDCGLGPGMSCSVSIYDATPGYFLGKIVT
ncbi:tRNA (N(6)-L-threonylcarbamoyladenosine(37)-C(2))-methylthiotransferase [Methanolobus halotolerans]|uniref:tRNA-t(6)A37 methylthiotransferase n=1 Tax=Methanolobus halotolerans TaxID=2052935 RepID=A0A4E0PU05_9EURY|nr:tRNA (N(6)-L-threonylcarbamoyladenosine(37)-C(2))-methylthiotransferase [Methanolobus halotolerans]TGC08429.1 2-methylthioadenine synthetase [Methanolobus halotolerans]